MANEFINREASFEKWRDTNPKGFVINSRKNLETNYCVLHRATCRHIISHKNAGAFTTRQYVKICSNNLNDLRTWIKTHKPFVSNYGKECKSCNPIHSHS